MVRVKTHIALPVNRPLATAAVALLTAAGAVLAAAPVTAHAETQVLTDPAGDRKPRGAIGDIVKTRVQHGPHALKVTVTHRPNDDRTVEDVTLVFVDTDARNPGPEYRVAAGLETEQVSVTRVDDWRRLGGTAVPCDDARMVFDLDPSVPLRIKVPRSCLGNPDRLRASVATEPDYPFKRVDWAPGKKTFGRWLVSGAAGR
jgi:hypothetical protein